MAGRRRTPRTPWPAAPTVSTWTTRDASRRWPSSTGSAHCRSARSCSSPLLRCRRTVEPLAAALGLEPIVDERISEVDYGQWTGRKIGDLVKEPLWAVVQQQPSAAVFPEGEGLAHVQARAVAAVREHDRRLAEEHDGDVLWVACTHGDVIKAVVADALGTHLDSFQRITADPASMSVIRYTAVRPFVIHVNHTGAQLTAGLMRQAGQGRADGNADDVPPGDAVVGGSTD